MGLMMGCEADIDAPKIDDLLDTSDQAASAQTPTEQTSSTPETASSSSSRSGSSSANGPINLGAVHWLHTNVSGWSQTASLSVRISGGTIYLNYNKARVWPGVNTMGAFVNANPWVFVNRGGTWYAATFEWLRVGQTSKPTATVNGDHIKKPPLNNFVPRSGETYGFMVSGLARTSTRNVRERSNIVMVRWP
jgi:hypothetical protein